MAKNDMTMTRRALSNICTGLCTICVYLLFSNLWVTLLSLVGFALIFTVLFTKHGFTKRFKVLLLVLLAIVIALMCFFRFRPVDNKNVDNGPAIVDVQEDDDDKDVTDPTDDQEVITDDEDNGSSSGGKNWDPANVPDKIKPTYSNTDGLTKPNGGNDGNNGQGETKVEGPTVTQVTGNSQSSDEELKAAQDAENNGDKMENLNEGVIAGTKEPVKEDEKEPVKDESTREDPAKNHVEEVKPGTTDTPPTTGDQVSLEDQLKEDLTDDELEDLFQSTSKEEDSKGEDNSQGGNESQTKPDDEESQQQPVKPDDSDSKEDDADDQDNTDSDEVEKPENETPTKPEGGENVEENDGNDVTDEVPDQGEKEEETVQPTPVTITPLDGDQAYAGDSVQFKLTGEVKGVTGLDGLQYTISNGYLTVETNPDEATVLTPIIIGADGVSTATTSVTINVINVQ